MSRLPVSLQTAPADATPSAVKAPDVSEFQHMAPVVDARGLPPPLRPADGGSGAATIKF